MKTYEQMIALAQGTQLAACKVAAAIHPEDRARADAFASEVGGYDIVAVKFPELLAGAKSEEERGELLQSWAATLLGVTAIARSLGHSLHV